MNKKETKIVLQNKLKENTILNSIIEKISIGYISSLQLLVGGAVVDILEDRIPKDYDFVGFDKKKINDIYESGNLTFTRDTSTAVTFTDNDNNIIQFLKSPIEDFEFTISQSSYEIKTKNINIDFISFYNKVLIPIRYDADTCVKCLLRTPHWKNKGYLLDDITYFSLINNSLERKINFNS